MEEANRRVVTAVGRVRRQMRVAMAMVGGRVSRRVMAMAMAMAMVVVGRVRRRAMVGGRVSRRAMAMVVAEGDQTRTRSKPARASSRCPLPNLRSVITAAADAILIAKPSASEHPHRRLICNVRPEWEVLVTHSSKGTGFATYGPASCARTFYARALP